MSAHHLPSPRFSASTKRHGGRRLRRVAVVVATILAVLAPVAAVDADPGPMLMLEPTSPSAFAQFGWSVDVDGDTMVVGALREDSDRGAAYVFVRDGDGWTQQARLAPSDPQQPHFFGHAVAIEGDTIVVGAPLDNDLGTTTGAVYVFTRSGSTWTEQTQLYGNGWLGEDVDISGTTIAASANYYTGGGAVFTFVGSGASWSQEQIVQPADLADGDRFGREVAIEADTMLIRSNGVDKTYIFDRDVGGWSETTKLVNPLPDATPGAWRIALDGDTALVSQRIGFGSDLVIAANVFVRAAGVWSHQATLPGYGIDSGPVALDGDTALVGFPYVAAPKYRSGAFAVYDRSGTVWTLREVLNAAPTTTPEATFGWALALQGDEAFVGAPGKVGVGGALFVADVTAHPHFCAGLEATILGTPMADDILGTPGDDVIIAFESDDTIDGAGGNDTICAGAGNDFVDGGSGDDALYGEMGIDTLSFASSPGGVTVHLPQRSATGNGTDTIVSFENVEATPFDDSIVGNARHNILSGLAGKDIIKGGGGNDQLLGGADSDRLFGGNGNDVLRGGNGWDRLTGGPGNDNLFGEGGVDTVDYAGAPSGVVVDLGAGTATGGDGSDKLGSIENAAGSKHADTLRGNGMANKLLGRAGNDMILGRGDDDVLFGGGGIDTVTFAGANVPLTIDLAVGFASGLGADKLSGFENAVGGKMGDVIIGTSSANVLSGGAGADVIRGRGGPDTLNGGGGDDDLWGGGASDLLNGGPGRDYLVGGAGSDDIRGQTGIDITSYEDSTRGVRVDLAAGSSTGWGADVLRSVENVIGSDHADTIFGNAGDNLMLGLGGPDTIVGREGDDLAAGGDGDDTLRGGSGNDLLAGEEGDDTLEGGPGFDYASWRFAGGPVTASLIANTGTGQGTDTLKSMEGLEGGPYADRLTGNGSSNGLYGNAGADGLIANGGDDGLFGGSGNDNLSGGSGFDELWGGPGTDSLDGGPDFDVCYEGETVVNCEVEGDISHDDPLVAPADVSTLLGWSQIWSAYLGDP